MYTFLPEAGDLHQYLKAVLAQVSLVASIVHIVVDSIGNGTVAVNFLEGNLPLVVAFLAVHCHHWIKRTFFEAELAGVFLGFFQMLIAIDQQITGNGGIRST
ncbi:hypothetical protein D3C73_1512330 [compost metagenome]